MVYVVEVIILAYMQCDTCDWAKWVYLDCLLMQLPRTKDLAAEELAMVPSYIHYRPRL